MNDMDYGLKEMNEMDDGLKEVRGYMITEVDTVTRVEARPSDDVIMQTNNRTEWLYFMVTPLFLLFANDITWKLQVVYGLCFVTF